MSLEIVLVIVLTIGAINSQQVISDGAGSTYVCVPVGYCNNGPYPSPGIDPRIVTPDQPCPAGQIPCYTQGPLSQCGNRLDPSASFDTYQAPPGANPWQAYLRNSTHPNYAGSGVLIDNYHVLTAAHKVNGDRNNPAAVMVIMGVDNPYNINGNTQTRTASMIIVHPNYQSDTLLNDIAIIEVSQPFSLSQNNINTACLPSAAAVYTGQRCIVAGWGETNFNQNDEPVNPMKQITVPVVDYGTCRQSFASGSLPNVDNYLDGTTEICAGGESMLDACTYDGGAPLMCPRQGPSASIAGLVIWGKGCGTPGVYGVYVSVPAYRGWIDSQIIS